MVSLALHAVIFVALYRVVYEQRAAPRRLIIPEARLAPEGAPVGEPSGGANSSRNTFRSGRASERSATPVAAGPVAPVLTPDALPVIAMPSDAGAALSGSNFVASVVTPSVGGSGSSGGAGGGGGSGRGLAGMGPATSFFGQGGNAYKVVYVIDASASIVYYMHDIVREMRQSIRDLIPTQQFHIIVAHEGRIDELSPRRLVPAIATYKQQAAEFLAGLEKIPEIGAADEQEAMRRAFAVKPELIYFLSDGDYVGARELQSTSQPTGTQLEGLLERLNSSGDVKITTIAFAPTPGPRALLERIARRHGGHFRSVEIKSER